MPARDPRSYVSVTPLPIGPQKGLKIQARSIAVYNPIEPSRDHVRKQNFVRRSAQISSQGFRSANHRPYHGIGDPFYLDEKKLILHALGQWDESQEWETSSSSEDEDSPADATLAHRGQMTAAKFVLRRTRKDLNTLSKEVVKGRQMIRNVRLGHGLFDLIRQERTSKKTAAILEKQRKLEAARNTWQPPKRDSDSDSQSDDDIIQDDDRYSSGETGRRSASGRKKKGAVPRPYTPQHNGLCEVNDLQEDGPQHALFRQLCVLNWILDAMNLEQGLTMSPIMTCWSHNEIGGTKVSVKKALQEKQAESRWERFLTTPMPGKIGKKVSTVRGPLTRHARQSVRLFNPRTSIQTPSPSPSSSSSAVNLASLTQATPTLSAWGGLAGMGAGLLAGAGSQAREEPITEEGKAASPVVPPSAPVPVQEPLPPPEEEVVDSVYSKSMFKFLDEYYDSLRREKTAEEEANQAANTAHPGGVSPQDKDKAHDGERRARKNRKKSKEREKTPDRLALPQKPVQHDMQEALGVPRGMRADKFVKPKPSAELLEFHETKASNKYVTLTVDLANKFKEVQDDKAMTLHDILEQMERERLSKCQSKYMSMYTDTSSVHRALEAMRREGERMLQKPSEESMRRKSSFRGNWYTDLHESIPYELKGVWYYQVILGKLRKYGLEIEDREDNVESTSKQSVYKFLKVLEGLRDWEICSPDISAAVEFCRERIVDLSVDDYEEWFKSVFPRISRPLTAPPALRGGDKKQSPGGVSVGSSLDASRPAVRQVQSAFVRRSQR